MDNIFLIPSDKLEKCNICTFLDNKKVRKTDRSFFVRKYVHRYIVPGLKVTISKNDSGEYVHGYDSYIPQGICVSSDYIFISAYDYKHELNSVIYVCERKNGRYITTLVLPVKSHCGGLAYDSNNNYIWVCDGMRMGGINYAGLAKYIAHADGKSVLCIDIKDFDYTFATQCTASFSNYHNGLVWVGQFDESSPMKVYGYKVNVEKGLSEVTIVLPVPKKTQGVAFCAEADKLYMLTSNSYGRDKYSRIYSFLIEGGDFARKVRGRYMIPMSEGIDIVGDKLYVVFESGAIKYSDSKHSKKPTDMYYVFNVKNFI